MKTVFHRSTTEPLAKILFTVAVLLGVVTLLKLAGFVMTSREAEGTTFGVAAPNGVDANGLDEPVARAQAFVEELKKKNLFVVPAPRQHPVREVLGILGSEALIDGKWYKVGDSVQGAKIVAIEPTRVRIVWDGQEKQFAPIGVDSAGGPPDRRSSSKGKPTSAAGARMVVTGSRRGPTREGPRSLSQDERDRLRQRWANMSPEERQRAREEMRERFGGRR
jgi:hypothetical protein